MKLKKIREDMQKDKLHGLKSTKMLCISKITHQLQKYIIH